MNLRVFGIPSPGGSKNAYAAKSKTGYTGKVALVDAGGVKTAAWRARVRTAATLSGMEPVASGPVMLVVTFYMPRPKKHFHRNGALRADAPSYHIIKPDVTKLIRSTEDSLLGIAWTDDSQVCSQHAAKIYSVAPGADIEISAITPTPA